MDVTREDIRTCYARVLHAEREAYDSEALRECNRQMRHLRALCPHPYTNRLWPASEWSRCDDCGLLFRYRGHE